MKGLNRHVDGMRFLTDGFVWSLYIAPVACTVFQVASLTLRNLPFGTPPFALQRR